MELKLGFIRELLPSYNDNPQLSFYRQVNLLFSLKFLGLYAT